MEIFCDESTLQGLIVSTNLKSVRKFRTLFRLVETTMLSTSSNKTVI